MKSLVVCNQHTLRLGYTAAELWSSSHERRSDTSSATIVASACLKVSDITPTEPWHILNNVGTAIAFDGQYNALSKVN